MTMEVKQQLTVSSMVQEVGSLTVQGHWRGWML